MHLERERNMAEEEVLFDDVYELCEVIGKYGIFYFLVIYRNQITS